MAIKAMKKHIGKVALGLALAAGATLACAQAYPSKPIKIVVGFPAGGGTDTFTRLIAGEMTKSLGESVVVENRSGANGVIGATSVAKSAPDGYTLMMVVSTHIMNAFSYKDLPFDVIGDFTPISALATTPYVLTANKDFPANSVKDLIDMAKAKPGAIDYASSGSGSTPHLFQALMNEQAGIELTHIPYRGGAPSLNDLLGGQVSLLMQSTVQSLPYIKDKRVKALAVTSAQRSEALPDVPTIAESGIPGYDAEMWWAVLGPKGMPTDIRRKLETLLIDIVSKKEVKDFLASQGARSIGSTSIGLTSIMKDEYKKWEPLFKQGLIN
ncbi:tripartite tricarboxylate transporter substrate binding protein [Alcaligenaceae bacterium]|nr:tripartite tricarboxylate transporter substrate binding protein [Alcaligenaceae bacterium]